MRKNNEQGFILALSVILVLVLGISGTGFMHLDYLERRMAMNEVDNHGGFYLANAGIERARETFKINTTGAPTWTPVLNETPPYVKDLIVTDPHYPSLCPIPQCIIPSFGREVNALSAPPLPFDATFDDGHYEVRAFNDASGPPLFGPPGETATADLNGILIFRAIGHVRGELKLLEAKVQAVSGLNLINCTQGPCPSKNNGQPAPCDVGTIPKCDPAEGREPAVGPLPTLDKISEGFYPLPNPQNYYRQQSNFPGFTYIYDNNPLGLTIKNITADHVVYFVEQEVTIGTNVNLTNAIVVGVTKVTLAGDGTISAPLPYPVVISGGDIKRSSGSATIFGNVYSVPPGIVDLGPAKIHGVIMGQSVQIQGSSIYQDDHQNLVDPLKYYAFMPGFYYPPEVKTTVVTAGGWKEIQ